MTPWYNLIYSTHEKEIAHKVLLNWSTYYRQLNKVNQLKFRLRCIRFYTTINWDSHHTFELSKQAKIIVSSAFTQITFGLRKHTLKDFETILIMPRAYTYIRKDLMFKGDVNLSHGRITLAWPAVEKGFLIPDDALNLCIHEFAHCLMLENRVSIFFYFFKYRHWQKYKRIAKPIEKSIKSGANTFFRKYGGTNEMEFFAVALESFFEQSILFRKKQPKLYKVLCILLNQDPSRPNKKLFF